MAVNVVMPQMGESVAEGTVVRWIKKPGERVERDEPLLEISTDKVDAEIPSPAAGVLAKILVNENQTVEVNTIIAEIEEHGVAPERMAEAEAPTAIAPAPGAADGTPAKPDSSAPAGRKLRASPLVRKIAQDNQVDLESVRGTGLGGRVSKKDVIAHLANRRKAAGQKVASHAPSTAPPQPAKPIPPVAPSLAPSAPTPPAFGGQSILMSPMRRQIAERMVISKRTSPHVATVFEVEMTRVAQTIAREGSEFERRNGIRLTYTPFLIRASVEALKQFPIVNASLEDGNIIYKRDVNIGVAVALETGLIVPVIKHADEKSFLGVARAVNDVAGRARSKRLGVEEVQDGTFTISNHGVTGSLIGTPIINQPQLAILGVGKIEKRPVVRDDAIAIRAMVYLTLSFDHRVLDGALADQFMASIKAALEGWDEPVL